MRTRPDAMGFTVEGQGHKTMSSRAVPVYTHILNLKSLQKIGAKPKHNRISGLTHIYPHTKFKTSTLNYL